MKVLDRRERIDRLGTAVIVTHDRPGKLRSGFLRGLDVPYPVLADLELDSYRGWGLGRASAAGTLLSPRVAAGYVKRIAGGERLGLPGTEPLQLGGDFVIDPAGRIAYSHPQQAVDDRPPVGLLLRELEAAAEASAAR